MHLPSFLSLDTYLSNEAAYRDQIRSGTYPQPIPLLNYAALHRLPDNTLVRFRGMIQDMLDPEIYLERYEVRTAEAGLRVQDGRFRDMLVRGAGESVDFECEHNVNGERRPLFLVSVPGINDWASRAEGGGGAEDEDDQLPTSLAGQCTVAETTDAHGASNSRKRSAEETEEAASDEAASTAASVSKKPTTDAPAEPCPPASLLSAQYLVNSPLPDRPGRSCLAKVYDDFDQFTLNTIVEVTGFLSVNPVLDAAAQCQPDDAADADPFREAAEVQAANPPPALVPRLHCVHVQPLKHTNPLLPAAVDEASPAEASGDAATYQDVLLVLTQCLFGDAVAAELLLCHLISTVYVRSELQAIGQFSLNLSQIPAAVLPWYTHELYELLESLVPVSHLMPLTLEHLNTAQFEPKKDYKTNKLTSGCLQLAPHTHLVLDETRLLAGRLDASGVAAVQSIAHLISQQQLKIDFQFYQLDFNADVPVLCLSEGRSMLPTNCHCPLQPADAAAVEQIRATIAAARHFLQPKLTTVRRWLTLLKVREFDMQPESLETIQADFVAMRRENAKCGADELHALLVLSRLVGLCLGGRALDADVWRRAKELEAARRQRLAAVAVAAAATTGAKK